MDENRVRAGIDVGGTKIAVGLLLEREPEREPDRGQVTALETFPTVQEPEACLDRIGHCLETLLQRQGKTGASLSAVGLAFPADLHPHTGHVITAPNLPAFVGLVPRDLMQQALVRRFSRRIPVTADNDTCAAVLAEARFGAGRDIERLFYLTVSTGVGGARYDGVRPVNVEPGMHTYPDPQRPGVRLDDLASGAALARRARRRIREALTAGGPLGQMTTVLAQDEFAQLPLEEALERLSARHLARAATEGDAFCAALLADSSRQTAASLRQLLRQGFGEERIIVGGSVALKTEGYLQSLRENLAQAFETRGEAPPLDPRKDVVEAGLGDDRGVVGAALLTLPP